jgi:hypothetical protein
LKITATTPNQAAAALSSLFIVDVALTQPRQISSNPDFRGDSGEIREKPAKR